MTEVGGAYQHHDATLASLISSTASSSRLTIPSDLADATSPSHVYLLSLTSHSLLDLQNQPAALSTAKSSLDNQLSSLCSQHVASFVQVHHATASLPTSLDSLDTVLHSLIEKDLPALSNAAQQFSKQVESPLEAKETAQNLISQYDSSLKDLLDIPRLLMTCVRANHPVEALSLGLHMMKVSNRSPHSSVIRSLQQECLAHLKRLREDLLRGLGNRGLRLPAAKRYVSLLRRLKDIDEANAEGNSERVKETNAKLSLSDSAICLFFLRSRSASIADLGSEESTTKSVLNLSTYISSWRDLVGDTCGMAQSLFSDSKNTNDDEMTPSTLISAFSHQASERLRRLLVLGIPHLLDQCSSLQDEVEILSEINTQVSYSAASLSRHGLDMSFLRRTEEEAKKRRQMAEEEARRNKEEEEAEALRKREDAEVQRKDREEAEALRRRAEEAEAQRVKSAQEEAVRTEKAKEEARRQKEADEELQRQRALEEKTRREKEAEEELVRQREAAAEEAEAAVQRNEKAEAVARREKEAEKEMARQKIAAEEKARQIAAEEEAIVERDAEEERQEIYQRKLAAEVTEREREESASRLKGQRDAEEEGKRREDQEYVQQVEEEETHCSDAILPHSEDGKDGEEQVTKLPIVDATNGGAGDENKPSKDIDTSSADEKAVPGLSSEETATEIGDSEGKAASGSSQEAAEGALDSRLVAPTQSTQALPSSKNKLAEKLRLRQEARERAAREGGNEL
ncbi:hypothetical protein CBS101457_004169 [Exobasidium rhododendri]|nr:hypothetical protein CBS101457_004169 [Exobasidium rhododendri]